MGLQGVPQLLGRPARARHLPPGEPRVHREGRLDTHRGRRDGRGLPGHARRDGLAHDDDQRARRARLGRRRHRGRGGHARAARLHAAPARRRLQALGQAPRGRHRDRPHADGHADAAPARRRRLVRRVLRAGPLVDVAAGPRDDRQHGPGVRRDLRLLPRRRRDAGLPAPHQPRPRDGRPRRAVLQGAGPLPDRRHAGPDLRRDARTGPRRRRAVYGRAEAPAGPHRAAGRPAVVHRQPHRPRRPAGLRPRHRRRLGARTSRRTGRS